MRREILSLLLAVVIAAPAFAAEGAKIWTNIERDVWTDQMLERPVLLYRGGDDTYLLLSDRFPHALILDVGAGETRSRSKSSVELADDLSAALTPDAPERRTGKIVETEDGVLIATIGRRSIVIAPHQSPAGEIDAARFLESYPTWRARMIAYEPDRDAIEALRAIDEPVELSVVFATWCGDSRRDVPRLLRAVEAAGNPNVMVRLIGIDSEFRQPLDVIHDRRIINVPTVIVERNGEEIGRIVETPATGAMEADVAAIVKGSPEEHLGRWERKARTARGVYRIDLADGTGGTEEWEVFATEAGGRLIHSVIRAGLVNREIWHRFDPAGRSEFIEITDRSEEGVQRSRIRVGTDHVRATSRGNRSGIIDQFLGVPPDCVFATGSVLSDGWECDSLTNTDATEIVRYAVPLDDCSGLGCLETVRLVKGASTTVGTVLGDMEVSEIEMAAGGLIRRVWMAKELSVPVRLDEAGRSAVLVELQ